MTTLHWGMYRNRKKWGIDGDGIPIGSPNRIDDHAKSTTEDPLGRLEMKWRPVSESQSKRIAHDQSATDGTAVRIGEDAQNSDEKKVSKQKELEGRKITRVWKRKWPPEWRKDSRTNNAADSKSKVK